MVKVRSSYLKPEEVNVISSATEALTECVLVGF